MTAACCSRDRVKIETKGLADWQRRRLAAELGPKEPQNFAGEETMQREANGKKKSSPARQQNWKSRKPTAKKRLQADAADSGAARAKGEQAARNERNDNLCAPVRSDN